MGDLRTAAIMATFVIGTTTRAPAQDINTETTPRPESLSFNSPTAQAQRVYSNKIFLRLSSGIISNVGTVKGSAFSFGGANVGGLLFITDKLVAGIAYKIETNLVSVPLKGFDLLGRYYFLRSGTVVTLQDTIGNRSVQHPSWSPYLGAEFSNRSFYVQGDPEAIDASNRALTGSLSAVNVSLGVDYRLSRNWELTSEMNVTVLPFAGSDPRVKIRWILGSLGVNYVF